MLAMCTTLSAAITQCDVAAFTQLGVTAVAAFTQCAVAAFTQSDVAAVAAFTQCDVAAGTSEHIRPRGVDPAAMVVQALVSRTRSGCCELP